jgi:hypothetical protein
VPPHRPPRRVHDALLTVAAIYLAPVLVAALGVVHVLTTTHQVEGRCGARGL